MAYQDTSLILAQPVKTTSTSAPPDQRPPFWKRKKWAPPPGRVRSRPGALSRCARRVSHAHRKTALRGGQGVGLQPEGAAPRRAHHRSGPDEVGMPHPSRMPRRGVGVVYVSHRLPEVLEIADRITVLRDGRTRGDIRRQGAGEHALVDLIVGRPFKRRSAPSPTGERRGAGRRRLQGQSFGPVSSPWRAERWSGSLGAEQRAIPTVRPRRGRRPGREGGVRRPRAQLDLDPPGGAVGVMLLRGIASKRR